MEKAGFLQASNNAELGYTLAESFNKWGGPLRHNFHTASIDDGNIFDVWWAVDFLLLVNSLSENKIKIDDSCAHCSKRISVVIDKAKITTLEPESVFIQRGGGWAVDNLFWSEEHLNEWLNEYPEYKKLQQQSIAEFLDKVKSN